MGQVSRQAKIVEMVKEQGFVTIEHFVNFFKVTPQTIRRDLNQLAEQNQIRRHHGGAGLDSSTENTSYNTRKISQLEEKQRIAQAVVSHIPDHASLFINIGTTTETIARALLNHQGLQVVTNNLNVASILSNKEDFNVIIAGGMVRSRDGGIVGEATRDFIGQFKMDYGIIGISGIDGDGSLLDFDYQEVRIAQAIMENSRNVFLAADHSKFGRSAMVRLGNIKQADRLFTDRKPVKNILNILKEHNVCLDVAG
ncbi:DeoR/GlpR family transcriptional regulator [Thalassomonas haliotis]|uniref:DeoR/GlpR family transcriptional regulator n=1 Tax=Thalassomonas haliotis TaxID=485448 RepID=A0ABY7VCL1_9GAMM|nr:DeoR/GlpR family transcriptional regulator [Thalassomonas haliotis]WDE11374.1 DeoR/GlpR family transcriptional regulator [Thalassomonas haliotis]